MKPAVKLSLAVVAFGLAACSDTPNPTDAAAPEGLQPSFSLNANRGGCLLTWG